MSIKKKLLIALLSATVAVAGTASLAACNNTTTPPGPGPGPGPEPGPGGTTENPTSVTVSDEAYEIAVANGATGTKDEWLADLKSTYAIDGKELKSVSANAEGNVVLTYADDSTQNVTMNVKLYKVICKDNVSGALLANAWFEIGYLDGYTFKNSSSAKNRYAKSGDDGIALFCVTPEEGIDYIVKLADPNNLEVELGADAPASVIPENYVSAFGTDKYMMPITSLSFDSSRRTEAMFENAANYFYFAEKTPLGPVRTTVDVKANVYNYVVFKAGNAGRYKFTVTPESGVAFYCFEGSGSYMPLNEKKIPAIVQFATGGVKDAPYDNGENYGSGTYTGDNSITLNITSDITEKEIFFGIFSETAGEVQISVERIGDAIEEAPVEETKMQAPANIEKYGEKPANTTLTLMPATGALAVVKGDDGYYRVGTKNGPVLLVQLNNALSRVSNEAISKLPEVVLPGSTDPQGDVALTFTISENGKIIAKRNYAEVIAAYSAKANSDGVYGVDETLYGFLQDYAAAGSMFEAKPGNQYNWLLPCQYYQPEEGLPVTGSGTEQDPYVLMNGNNSIEVNGTAYLSFTAADAGIYTFKSSEGEVVNGSAFASDYNNSRLLYVCVTADYSEIKLTLGGSGTVSVMVASYDQSNRNIKAEYDDDKQVTTGTEANPIDIMPGVNNVILTTANEDGVWVTFNSPVIIRSTEYEFKIYDENLQIHYNGNIYDNTNVLKLTLEDDTTEFKLLITTKKNGDGTIYYGNYMLNIKTVQ